MMQRDDAICTSRVALAEKAAEQLFRSKDPAAVAEYEPCNSLEAIAAVGQLGQCFEDLPGVVTRVLRAATDSANLLSEDRLQGLSEIVQNADDAGATQVRLLLRPNDLLVSHDGSPVRLHHVLGFATPWLSTKGDDAASIGRFGIGLMTLRSLSRTLEVHCPPYHVRLGDPTISTIDRPTLPAAFQEAGWTTLRVPLETRSVGLEEVVKWLDRWDDSALLFLRHVTRVTLLLPEGTAMRELTLRRYDDGELVKSESAPTQSVSRHHAEAGNGRSWLVYSADVESPSDVFREGKATNDTTPIAVALPLQPTEVGKIHAGLPVAQTRLPLFASAQFDPLTSRLGFGSTSWNQELVPLVAKLWSDATLDCFTRYPRAAWHSVPIMVTEEQYTGSSLVQTLENAVADRARMWLSSRLSFDVPGQGLVRLSNLAVESPPLESVLTEAEIASLAGLPAALPSGIRDQMGRWRCVLDDWRSAGADLPVPVSVEKALDLIGDERRSPESTIALTATALNENLGEQLLKLPCVITDDGRHLVPPTEDSPEAIAASAAQLGGQLGIVSLLHPAHLRDEKAALEVLEWLGGCGALIDDNDDRAVVYRLAAAGRSGHRLEQPLTDEQVRTLRDTFELMDRDDQRAIGENVGRAILLEAFAFKGKRHDPTIACPADAYIPGRIDRETDSFAAAAEQTPGVVWMSEKYWRVLRSPAGRNGIGALRFLRILGANSAPRVSKHPDLEVRFQNERRRGLHRAYRTRLEERDREMRKRDATYTLDDYHNPDLIAVAQNIARQRGKGKRRKRAAALLATLGRAWQRVLSDFAEVDAAEDYFYWRQRGQIRAYWLWELGSIPWLDDESGTPRRPIELRIRNPGNVAIYGEDSPDFLHKDLDTPIRHPLMRAIGVSGDPSRSQLVDRLRSLRDEPQEEEGEFSREELQQESAVVYRALAHDVSANRRSDLSAEQLQIQFRSGPGLILTDHGWLSPRSVLTGPPIFGKYAAFAPSVRGTEPLWSALKLKQPSPENCLKVIHSIAGNKAGPEGDDETILLETLRALASHYVEGNRLPTRKVRELVLWTSQGWKRKRPVYATDDPTLAKGLGNRIPIWEPGGELEQFRPLLGPFRVDEIRAADARVIEPELAEEDLDATHLFRSALALLREDLARNDPRLAASIEVSWEVLGGFDVSVHQSLSLRVEVTVGASTEKYICEVDAKIDTALQRLYVRHPSYLPRVEGGGRAIASLFEGNTRRLAQAWRAAYDLAEDGREADAIELAEQRAKRIKEETDPGISRRTLRFQERTAESQGSTPRPASKATSRGSQSVRNGSQNSDNLGAVRVLVDPDSLRLVDPRGRIEGGKKSTHRRTGHSGGLADPRQRSTGPRNRTPIPGYSAVDRESVGMDLVRVMLSSDIDDIVDLRTQRGVGADAIDSMESFYELKVSAGPEPDSVTLTNAEVRRALSTPNYFLIVISGIEGVDARPKARVFVDPLKQLQLVERASITLSGVQSAESLVYDFEPDGDESA